MAQGAKKLSCRRAAAALLQSSLTGRRAAGGAARQFCCRRRIRCSKNTKIAERVWQVLQQFEQKEKLRLPDAGLPDACHPLHADSVQQLREQGGSSAAVHPPENAAQRLGGSFGTGVRPDAADRGSTVFRAVSGSVYHR